LLLSSLSLLLQHVSDLYVTESQFAVLSAADGGEPYDLAESIVSPTPTPTAAGNYGTSNIVLEYFISNNMLEQLESSLSLRGHFSSKEIDILSRLGQDISFENCLKYYQDMISIVIDQTTFLSILTIRAFSADMSQKLSKKSLNLVKNW